MKISVQKREKISEQIIFFLYLSSPRAVFTVQIAREIARDEEFTKALLMDLKRKRIVEEIKKNPQGKDYLKRSRWKISDKVYRAYKLKQSEQVM